ncbi:dihydroorotase [Desulfocucumis palustris]|uniref:Dihydroorotase n=1 Tax=Desulfocucumis palustris TaxID=1898651 RepID=A0A2L2X9P2_9FIRM|nr:dihydroorotase [Desulfocucumis palustris]GBF32987.1 dihydroorotase [Desulfocucumis palustris]
MRILIKGGRIIDPVENKDKTLDVLIENGKISALEKKLAADGAVTVDASGLLVAPGLIDMHVHLREPGYEAKETIETGLKAAVRGGFTGVACMPNTNPVADNQTVIKYIIDRASALGLARVWPIGALTRGSRGEQLTEMADLKNAGAAALSDDGRPVAGSGIMRRAMQYARMVGLTVISHCEDPELAAGGSMNEGFISTRLGLKGIPGAAEEVMVARDIILSELTGCPLHIAHVSTRGSVRLVREAKARGLKVTAEATPHHFTLTDAAVEGYNTSTKVNPPLRGEADVAAIKEGLADGTIDVIATDHAPHTMEEKDVEYDSAPFGLVGLETAVGLVWRELVRPGILTPAEAVAKMTVNPARLLGIEKDTLRPGAVADITIIDPSLEETVDPLSFASKGRNTPFAGWKLKGLPVLTMVGGKIVYSHAGIKIL